MGLITRSYTELREAGRRATAPSRAITQPVRTDTRGGGGGGSDSNFVRVRNDTGVDLPEFSLMGLGAPIVLPQTNLAEFTQNLTLSGEFPLQSHFGRFGVLRSPIKIGEVGLAQVGGLCPAKVAFNSTTSLYPYADIEHAQSGALRAMTRGSAKIIWKETGVGIRWTVVYLSPWEPSLFPVLLAFASGADGTQFTAAAYTYNVSDPLTNTGIASQVDPAVLPHRWRRSIGAIATATFGLGYYDKTLDKVILTWVNETPRRGVC